MVSELSRHTHTIPDISSGNLSDSSREWLQSTTHKNYPILAETFTGFIDSNPRFHFTPTSFTFTPDSEMSRIAFLERGLRHGWSIVEEDSHFDVITNHIERIREHGLLPKTCVAAMPEGPHADIMKSHPRLFIDGLERIVERFGKHATPHKHRVFDKSYGCITDMQGAAVIVGEHVPIQTKGKFSRDSVSNNNLLRPRTHFASFGSSPSDIIGVIPFQMTQSIDCDDGRKEIDTRLLKQEILAQFSSNLVQFLKDASDAGAFQESERSNRAITLFERIRSNPQQR